MKSEKVVWPSLLLCQTFRIRSLLCFIMLACIQFLCWYLTFRTILPPGPQHSEFSWNNSEPYLIWLTLWFGQRAPFCPLLKCWYIELSTWLLYQSMSVGKLEIACHSASNLHSPPFCIPPPPWPKYEWHIALFQLVWEPLISLAIWHQLQILNLWVQHYSLFCYFSPP